MNNKMNYKISCSFGEVIDKITILKLKLKHATTETQIKNISFELNTIQNNCPLSTKDNELFKKLYDINKQLWDLEDNIRHKSELKQFDQQYLEYAENIHIMNDKRANIKKQINIAYNSDIIEEKIYTNKSNKSNILIPVHETKKQKELKELKELIQHVEELKDIYEVDETNETNDIHSTIVLQENDVFYESKPIQTNEPTGMNIQDDYKLLHLIKQNYGMGNYVLANDNIQVLLEKYKHYTNKNIFIADLYVSYCNICNVLHIDNVYRNRLEDIVKNIRSYTLHEQFIPFIYNIYCVDLLHKQQYSKAELYIKYHNYIPNLGTDMSFFKTGDRNKTLFMYYMGGIGDIFMFARIVFELCKTYKHNKIKWLINFKTMSWIIDKLFGSIPNITFIYDLNKQATGHFDYHCSLHKVLYYMGYNTYDKIPYSSYMKTVSMRVKDKHSSIIHTLTTSPNKSYIFNWHGNKINMHEKNNRSMELTDAISLFKLKNVNWIITSKEITDEEYSILKKYDNIFILNDEIANYDVDTSFYDTMIILQYVDAVISTDTSLVHVALTMDIQTYVLLVLGPEWRWGQQHDRTNWYPKATLLRQNKIHNWDNVITAVTQIVQQ